jgi:segregation and condensation protein B
VNAQALDPRSIEALLFVSDEPIASSTLAQALDVDRRAVEAACAELGRTLEERGSGLVLRQVAGGWRLFTHPDVAATVERFVVSSRQARLPKAALETLAIVAYKQPVTRHQISSIRGVNSDGVIRALADRGLIAEAGREDSIGRPVLYATTPAFLERLGLASLADLPSIAPLLGGGVAEDVPDDLVDVSDAGRGEAASPDEPPNHAEPDASSGKGSGGS